MRIQTLLLILFFCSSLAFVQAQGVGINTTNTSPDSSAMLDVKSISKGILIPRMSTTQRNSINSPAEGLQIFNTVTKCFEFYANTVWQTMFCSCASPSAPTAGTNTISQTQIIWNWNAITGATDYKYNTINDLSTATDNGTGTSYTQTGLSCGTSYTLYVWAYQGACNSSVATFTQSTTICCVDGSGGSISHGSGYTIHTYLSSGSFTPPACVSSINILLVGGGGGGCTGGGGGGGVVTNSAYGVSYQSYSVTVGNAGNGVGAGVSPGGNGGNSVFDQITAYGGGGGGGTGAGNTGGSGGGGGIWSGNPQSGGAAVSSGQQGNNGGNSSNSGGGAPYSAGGGGGAGSYGSTSSGGTGGTGGAGLSVSLPGISGTYAGGGGGGGYNSSSTGGSGGGGAGGGLNGSAATPNTGGGGGGASTNYFGNGNRYGTAGGGGTGIVIISYPTP